MLCPAETQRKELDSTSLSKPAPWCSSSNRFYLFALSVLLRRLNSSSLVPGAGNFPRPSTWRLPSTGEQQLCEILKADVRPPRAHGVYSADIQKHPRKTSPDAERKNGQCLQACGEPNKKSNQEEDSFSRLTKCHDGPAALAARYDYLLQDRCDSRPASENRFYTEGQQLRSAKLRSCLKYTTRTRELFSLHSLGFGSHVYCAAHRRYCTLR